MDLHDLAEIGAELLLVLGHLAHAFLDAVEGKQEDRKIVIPMELIIRQSSSRKQQQ
jgi:hypothetical protein